MKTPTKAFIVLAMLAVTAAVLALTAGCAQASSSQDSSANASDGQGQLASAQGAQSSSPADEEALYQQISGEDALALMQSESDYVILDVRRPNEFASGHIPDAVNLPVEDIGDAPPAELSDPYQLIMIYCRSGNRSKQAAEKLALMGYTNIVEFGGVNTWPGELVED